MESDIGTVLTQNAARLVGESRGGWEAGHQITYVWNLNYDTNEQIYEIDAQRTDLLRGGGWIWNLGLADATYRMDK